MKICQVIETSGGGSGRHVLDLSKELVGRGHKVDVAYSALRAETGFLTGLRELAEIRSHSIPIDTAPSLSDFKSIHALRQVLRQYGPFDVVHPHSSKAGAIARVAAWLEHIPCVYTPHAMASLSPEISTVRRRLYNTTEMILGHLASKRIICVSDFERRHAIESGLPGRKLVVVPNGVKPSGEHSVARRYARRALGLMDGTFYAGFVGRMVPQKAPERFLAAIDPIARCSRFRAVMVGDGPLLPAAKSFSDAKGMGGKVTFLGARDASSLMAGFDVFVLTSKYEAMPYVLLEALAAGLPIVTFDVGGSRETVVDGTNGFVVANGDTEAMTRKIELLLQNEELRSHMSKASLALAQGFSVERMVQNTEAIYRRVIRAERLETTKPETVTS